MRFPSGETVTWADLARIAEAERKCFLVEDGQVELLAALDRQGRVAQVAEHEVADVGERRGPGRERLGDHEDRVDDDRVRWLRLRAVGHPVARSVPTALLQGSLPYRRQFVRL